MDTIFFIYLICGVAAAVIITYLAIRAIDFGFTAKEDERRHDYELENIVCKADYNQMLAKDTIKRINKNLYNLANNYTDQLS